MKRTLYLLIFILSLSHFSYAQVATILEDNASSPGTWLCFRTTIDLDAEPSQTELKIAADSKYWLWVNGVLQVREGGLKRGPNPHDTYCDILKNTNGWVKGNNVVAVLVWYFGKDGFSHRNSSTPGISFELYADDKYINLSSGWKVIKHPAYYVPSGASPNSRLPESNIGFDATKDIQFHTTTFDDSNWGNANMVSLEDAGWNNLVDRPIPMWKDFGLKSYTHIQRNGNKIFAYLPYNSQVTPFIKLSAPAGQTIDIRTDNYKGGGEKNVYAEYITRNGVQEFECMGWMNGHYVIYTIPEGCEIIDLKYRETGYDTDFDGSFWCNDPALTQLWSKSQRTLYITMRDTYMDCPDRERAQWWGDVVNELGEAFYALDEKAHLLTRKAIHELMDWQRADSTIYSPVPSGNWHNELPMQILASISYYGFWTYYMGTNDISTIKHVFPKVKKYIHVWKTDAEGLVIPRSGGWTWGDWGDNKDMYLLFNQWYAIALQGYACMAELIKDECEAKWAKDVAHKLKQSFHEKFWNGAYYQSPDYKGEPDDRAQALAIISGTLPQSHYPTIRGFFTQQYHASPYMEKYVLQALCEMGYHQDAMNRMKLRYNDMINSNLSTLWEGWGIGEKGFGGGSYNHAWSGGALTILSSYIAGIQTKEPAFKSFTVCPNMGALNHIKVSIPLTGNRRINAEMKKTPEKSTVKLDIPKHTRAEILLPIGYSKIIANGKTIAPGTQLKEGKWEILFQ